MNGRAIEPKNVFNQPCRGIVLFDRLTIEFTITINTLSRACGIICIREFSNYGRPAVSRSRLRYRNDFEISFGYLMYRIIIPLGRGNNGIERFFLAKALSTRLLAGL